MVKLSAEDVVEKIRSTVSSTRDISPEPTTVINELNSSQELTSRYSIYSKLPYPFNSIAVWVRRLIHAEVRRYVDPQLEQQIYFNKRCTKAISDVLRQDERKFADVERALTEQWRQNERKFADVEKVLTEQWSWMDRARKEIMHEVSQTARPETKTASPKIPDPVSFEQKKRQMVDGLKVNLGAGALTLNGYINVDSRELEGIDLVCDARDLPFEPGSVLELRLAHLIEHFEAYSMRNSIMPYWASLIKNGGKIRIITPNWQAMMDGYINKQVAYRDLLEVTFGSQEYAGNYHYNLFTPDSLSELLRDSGFSGIVVVAPSRRNGICLEMEVEATRS